MIRLWNLCGCKWSRTIDTSYGGDCSTYWAITTDSLFIVSYYTALFINICNYWLGFAALPLRYIYQTSRVLTLRLEHFDILPKHTVIEMDLRYRTCSQFPVLQLEVLEPCYPIIGQEHQGTVRNIILQKSPHLYFFDQLKQAITCRI